MSTSNITTTLRLQIDAMVRWLCAEGRAIPPAVLSQLDASDVVTMGRVHHELARLVEPARPGTIQLFDELGTGLSSEFFGIKRAIRLARGFIYLALFSLASFMLLATALGVFEIRSYVVTPDSTSPTGWETIVNLLYLLLAASLGASFQTLFTLNRYIVNATYDPTTSPTSFATSWAWWLGSCWPNCFGRSLVAGRCSRMARRSRCRTPRSRHWSSPRP